MSSDKKYRLKVRKIPLSEAIPINPIRFQPLEHLNLEQLENKNKIKKNAPKPIFVREPEWNNIAARSSSSDSEDDFVLKELEQTYGGPEVSDDESSEPVFKSSSVQPESNHQPETTQSEQQPRQYYFEESNQDSEEQEKEEHANLLFKFMVLRKQYPNVEIPEFTDHSDLDTMRRVYEKIIRQVSLDSSVETYKQYLVGGLMVMEWISVNWIGIDLGGFTQQQIRLSNKYDRLLLELGEKNYSPGGSRFPVEVRICFFILFQAGLFYVQKSVFSGGGENLFNMMYGQQPPASPSRQTPSSRKPRQRMRGPTISPDEVEELAKQAAANASSSESS